MTANEPPSRWLAIGPGLVALAMLFTDATSQAHRVAIYVLMVGSAMLALAILLPRRP